MPTDMQSIVSVVLSGGAGTRLWPASRESHPKPFMKLADGQTLIEKTYARAAYFTERDRSFHANVTK